MRRYLIPYQYTLYSKGRLVVKPHPWQLGHYVYLAVYWATQQRMLLN